MARQWQPVGSGAQEALRDTQKARCAEEKRQTGSAASIGKVGCAASSPALLMNSRPISRVNCLLRVCVAPFPFLSVTFFYYKMFFSFHMFFFIFSIIINCK